MIRLSSSFVRTLREDPADAEIASHKLLVRAGYIRRSAPGVYTWLPLGLKVLRKAAKDGVIALDEMDVKALQKIVADYTGVGLRELSGAVKDIAQQQAALETQLLDAPDAAPELHVQLTLVDPAARGTSEEEQGA